MTVPATRLEVPVDWTALEDAFEANAPEVHCFLHVTTGEVVRMVDGIADPVLRGALAGSSNYLAIRPVSSREQYRWMEQFIETVQSVPLRKQLSEAIVGRGAFRQFKNVVLRNPEESDRWFSYRAERLRRTIDEWLSSNSLVAIARPPASGAQPLREDRATQRGEGEAEALRRDLGETVADLGMRELETLLAMVRFLVARRASVGNIDDLE